jgi:excisionase family DNA binding protein
MEKMLFTVEETAEILGIGRSRVYDLIRDGRIRSLKIGISRRLTHEMIAEFVRSLEQDPAA